MSLITMSSPISWKYSPGFSLHGSWAGIRCGDGVMVSFVLFVWPGFARLAFGLLFHQVYESLVSSR